MPVFGITSDYRRPGPRRQGTEDMFAAPSVDIDLIAGSNPDARNEESPVEIDERGTKRELND